MGIFEKCVELANKHFDGHLTVMKFTKNWRVGFMTPSEREHIMLMPYGKTLDEAAFKLLELFSLGMGENSDVYQAYVYCLEELQRGYLAESVDDKLFSVLMEHRGEKPEELIELIKTYAELTLEEDIKKLEGYF